jgi:hypothetical protein
MSGKGDPRPALNRWGCGFVGAVLIGTSLPGMLKGNWNYEPWHGGGLVFAPVALLLGVVWLGAGVFNWTKFFFAPETKSHRKKKH